MWEELYIAASNRLPLAHASKPGCLVHSISTVIVLTVWEQEMRLDPDLRRGYQEAYDNMVQAFAFRARKDVADHDLSG